MQTTLELYQRIQRLAGLGIFERNYQTGEMYWNKVVRSILEVSDDFTISLEESVKFFKYPDQVTQLIEAAIETGEPQSATLEILTAANNEKWVRIRLQAEVENGRCRVLFGTLDDVTDHVRLVSLLEERERRFSQAFDHAPIGMALVSLTGSWLKANHSLCRLLGYTEKNFLKHTFQDFTHPEDLDTDLKQVQELIAGRIKSYSMEKRYLHAAGHEIWALLNVSLIRDDNGSPLYFVSQIKDITERKRNSEIIKDQNSRLLNFAHIVSHNLRLHTGSMKMLTDMIVEEADRNEQEHLIKLLKKSSENLLVTLEDLNEIVKVEDLHAVDRKPVNLNQVATRVADTLLPSIVHARGAVTIAIPDDLVINANPAYIESIIVNLMSNSLKYRDASKTLMIKLTAEKTASAILLLIEDNGQGIDLERHGHKLFGMYNTFHHHHDARGLGLFMVKNQVEAMGGHIAVESQPGSGAKFKITFDQHAN